MLFRKTTTDQLRDALAIANDRTQAPARALLKTSYDGNLTLVDVEQRGNNATARLSVHRSKCYGARTSKSGRHGLYASWEAHRDFFRALFALNEHAIIVTSLAKYNAENFESEFPKTAFINIGSQSNPVTMPDCTI